jgi:diguanylate cyclase (GGDEF)-like protein
VLFEITNSVQNAALTGTVPRLDDIAASADEMLTLYELAGALAGQASISDTGDVIANHLRRLIPYSLSVLFIYDVGSDELQARHVIGDVGGLVRNLRIARGQRLSGWVAANRQTIINSDPVLDFGDVARNSSFRLRSCLSTPLVSTDQLVGVLSLYSEVPDGFTDDHRRVIEVVGRQVAHTFKCASDYDNKSRRDPLTGLPSLTQLEQLLASSSESAAPDLTLLFLDIIGLKEIIARYGHDIGDEVIRHVVRHTRGALRVADILFRYDSDEFVAMLNNTDAATAALIATRIESDIREHGLPIASGTVLNVETIATCVSAPNDGSCLRELVNVAQTRQGVHRRVSIPLVH